MAILAGIQDITEQKRVEEILSSARKQAEESNQLKDRFISLVSHDLRGPIGGIQTMSEMLISPEYKDTIQKEGSIKFLTMINKTSTGLIELLNQLLNITRLKTGRIIPIKKHLDAKTLVENIHMTLNVKMEEMGIHFENEIESGKSIYADPHLLGEVVSNLLTNAIKFTPKGGTIFVGMEKEDEDYTYLWIKDSGTGIPPAILPDIFKHEVKTTLVGLHGEKGTGLGLPYCKDIIDAHGGSIDVSSDKNKGTCFKIILPKIRPSILIVDDLEAHRIIAKDVFLKSDIWVDILEAGNGNQALKILENVKPDIIITDINMPEKNGWEFIFELRSESKWKDVPIFVMSADLSESNDFENKQIELDIKEFITKPIRAEELISKVNPYLKKQVILT